MTTTEHPTRRMRQSPRIADSWVSGAPRSGGAHRATATRPANTAAASSISTAVTAPIPIVHAVPATPPALEAAGESGQRPTLAGRLGDWILNALAVFGILCIALTVAAVVGNYTIIMFKTGSMDPTIPQGAIAVVHEIPATEVRIGDVITVDREAGEKPITHRVIGVEPVGGGEMLISMQGDANPTPDPEPYRVSQVREVVWSAPGLAKYIIWLSNPYVLGGITIGASLLVLWAYWPRRRTDVPRS